MSAKAQARVERRDLLLCGAAGLVYAASHQLGTQFLSPISHVSPLWPASGVAIAALLLVPRRLWLGLATCIGAAALVSNLANGNSFRVSVGYTLANLLEFGFGAWLLGRREGRRVSFERVEEVLSLLALATLGTGVAALLGALTTALSNQVGFADAYGIWWVANSLGILLVTPLVVTFAKVLSARPLVRPRRPLEATAFFVSWCVATWLSFRDETPGPLAPRPYALIALLAWAALRLGQRGVTLSLALLAGVAVTSAASPGSSASLGLLDPTERLLSVQVYLAITSITGLLLAASATETHAAEQSANDGRSRLRALGEVAQRDAERLRLALDATRMGTWEWNLSTNDVVWSEGVEAMFGLGKGQFRGTFEAYSELLYPEDRERALLTIQRTANGENPDFKLEHRVIWPDGSLHWVEGRGQLHRDEATGVARMIGTIVDVSERKLSDAKLRNANRALRTLSNCNQALVHARTESELLHEVCRVIVEDGGYGLSCVGFAVPDQPGTVRLTAHSGGEKLSPEPIEPALAETTSAVLRKGEPILSAGAERTLVVPLKNGVQTFGVILVRAADAQAFDAAEIELLRELAEDLSYGIQTLRARIDQQRAEEAVVAGEALLRQFIKHTPAAVAMFDTEMRYLYAAERWLVDYHLEGQDVIGRSHYEVFPDIPEEWKAIHRRVLAGAVERREEDPFPREDGSMEWLAWDVRPWRKAGGEIGGLIMFTQVITQRKLVEERLRRSEDRFRRLIENASDMITVLSNTGMIRFQSPSSERVLGMPPEELVGRSVFELLHPDDLSLTSETLRNAENNPAVPAVVKVRLRHRDGAFRLVECIGRSVPGESPDGYLVVNTRDITESAALQEQLRQTQKLEALGTLAGGIAHDFNNILSAIISFTELAKMDNPDNAELSDNLSEVLKACGRATNLVSQILSFSRQQRQERRKIPITPVIGEVLRLLRSSLPSTIEIGKNFEPNLPQVLADATQLHQVLMNLCTNAAHAMNGRGQLKVTLSAYKLPPNAQSPHPELAPGDYLRLEVSDTGMGMDAAVANRIFEPFFTTKRPGEGTGLGLSVVHGIIKDHDGVITVESEVGRGTTFRIYLPAVIAETRVEPDQVLEGVPRGRGERVLFVDDEPTLCDAAERILLRLGYQPIVFPSSELAFQALQRDPHRFDVVLTDLTMPNMTGVDLISEVRKLRPSLPIVLTSGYSGSLTSQTMAELGVQAVIDKPLDYRALGLAMARCCSTALGLDRAPQAG
ncbi:MAG TPA: PAS domain S-box protein [Polyangiaceae bacterium]|nr:PAS domain S-box protein [Polyangiaceae bacterium]